VEMDLRGVFRNPAPLMEARMIKAGPPRSMWQGLAALRPSRWQTCRLPLKSAASRVRIALMRQTTWCCAKIEKRPPKLDLDVLCPICQRPNVDDVGGHYMSLIRGRQHEDAFPKSC